MADNFGQTSAPLMQRCDAWGKPEISHWTKHTRFDWDNILQGIDTRGRRADAFGNEFIVPDLIYISKEVNRQVFPENTFSRAFASPVAQPPWMSKVYDYNDETYSGSPEDENGEWSDPGVAVGINRKPNLSPIRPFTCNYSVNIAELAQWATIGASAMAEKAVQARRVAEQALDIRAWLGRPNLGIPGYANTVGISRDTVPTVGGHTTWADKSGPEIFEDCRLIYAAIIAASGGVWVPDSLWIPLKMRSILTKPMVLGGTMLMTNVQQYIEMNLDLKIDYSVRLNSIDKTGGTGTGAVAMFRKSSDVQRSILPRGYYELGPQQVGRTMTVYADVVSGGLVVPQPTSAALWDGVA